MQQSIKEKLVLRAVNRLEAGDYYEALASSMLWTDAEQAGATCYGDRDKLAPRSAIRRQPPF